jgi:hypothetical protein
MNMTITAVHTAVRYTHKVGHPKSKGLALQIALTQINIGGLESNMAAIMAHIKNFSPLLI